jgi:hypothetical protein
VLGIGLGIGATATTGSGTAFTAGWMAVVGVGTGLTMATVASAALAELSAERAGVGSGVLQALKNTGAPLGAAILGSALTSAYIARLRLAGLPATAVHVAGQSIFAGVALARTARSVALLDAVRAAFVHGVDVTLIVSVGFAVLGAVLALAFLPGRAAPSAEAAPEQPEGERIAAGEPASDRPA